MNLWRSGLFVSQKVGGSNLQGFGELVQSSKCEVLLGPLDGAHVGAVQIALNGEFLLRPSPLLAQASHDGGNNVNRLAALHRRNDADMMRIALQGIASIFRG